MFLREGRVIIRPVEKKDLRSLMEWRWEPELRIRTRGMTPITEKDQESWYNNVVCGNPRSNFMFSVLVESEEPPSDKGFEILVGSVGLCHWDARDRSAEISFYLGDKEFSGKGVTQSALRMLMKWGFDELGLHRIHAECYDFNKPGIGILSKLGFVIEGKFAESAWRQGKWASSIIMRILEDEYRDAEVLHH